MRLQKGGTKEKKEVSKKTTKKTASKKTTKKTASKKTTKKKKEPKLKIYCGIEDPVPKGYKLGSMKECLDKKKVMYYGVKKVDSRMLQSLNKKVETEAELYVKAAGVRGKITKLKRELERSKSADEKKKLMEQLDAAKKEMISLAVKMDKLKQK